MASGEDGGSAMFLSGIRLDDLPGVLEFFDERRAGSLARDAAAFSPAPVPPCRVEPVRRRRGR